MHVPSLEEEKFAPFDDQNLYNGRWYNMVLIKNPKNHPWFHHVV